MTQPVDYTPAQMVRHFLQVMLDNAGDGWQIAQHAVCLGLERVNSDGELEFTPWIWTPPNQAEWMTDGLIRAVMELRLDADIDTD